MISLAHTNTRTHTRACTWTKAHREKPIEAFALCLGHSCALNRLRRCYLLPTTQRRTQQHRMLQHSNSICIASLCLVWRTICVCGAFMLLLLLVDAKIKTTVSYSNETMAMRLNYLSKLCSRFGQRKKRLRWHFDECICHQYPVVYWGDCSDSSHFISLLVLYLNSLNRHQFVKFVCLFDRVYIDPTFAIHIRFYLLFAGEKKKWKHTSYTHIIICDAINLFT